MAEPRTADDVGAVAAVKRKGGVAAVKTQDRVPGSLAILAQHRFVAGFAVLDPFAVKAIVGVVLGVLEQRKMRDDAIKMEKLFKECLLKIIRPPVAQRIPAIGIKTILTVDRKIAVGRVHGNHVLAAQIAGSRGERSLVAKRQAPLEPTVGTKRRLGHFHVEIKIPIVVINVEGPPAVLARDAFEHDLGFAAGS